jgi:hypothetical protein
VHLSELFGHSCYALQFKLFNTRVHRVVYERDPECELLPVLLRMGFVLLRSSDEKKTYPS